MTFDHSSFRNYVIVNHLDIVWASLINIHSYGSIGINIGFREINIEPNYKQTSLTRFLYLGQQILRVTSSTWIERYTLICITYAKITV